MTNSTYEKSIWNNGVLIKYKIENVPEDLIFENQVVSQDEETLKGSPLFSILEEYCDDIFNKYHNNIFGGNQAGEVVETLIYRSPFDMRIIKNISLIVQYTIEELESDDLNW